MYYKTTLGYISRISLDIKRVCWTLSKCASWCLYLAVIWVEYQEKRCSADSLSVNFQKRVSTQLCSSFLECIVTVPREQLKDKCKGACLEDSDLSVFKVLRIGLLEKYLDPAGTNHEVHCSSCSMSGLFRQLV